MQLSRMFTQDQSKLYPRSSSAPRGRGDLTEHSITSFRTDRKKNQSILSASILNNKVKSAKEELSAIERNALISKTPVSDGALLQRYQTQVLTDYQRGMVFYDKAQYDLALEKFKESLSTFFKCNLDDTEMLADIYLGMGITYHARNEDISALELYSKCVDTLESKFGKHYPGIVSALVNIGIIQSNQKKYTDALKTFMKAQKLAENVLGSQRIGLADIYHNIGVIYDEQSRLNDAMTFYDKSLRIREKIVGSFHPIVAMVYENMAQILKDQGDFKKATELQSKVLLIRKKHLGTNSLDYALALHNMGIICFKEKRYEQGAGYFNQAHKIRQQLLGPEHKATMCSLQLFEESEKRTLERRKRTTSMSCLQNSSAVSQSVNLSRN